MAMFYKPPGVKEPASDWMGLGVLPVEPPPPVIEPVDPGPWIEATLPPEDEKRPPPQAPPEVVIEPVVIPPVIVPPPPDMTPPTIVPPEYEEVIPEPLPVPPRGVRPVVRPPAALPVVGLRSIGTFMVYRGTKLILSMAASETGQQLIEDATAMLVGAVMKQLAPGTSIRFHTGRSPGDPIPLGGRRRASAASYGEAWRMVPQEFSYWEA